MGGRRATYRKLEGGELAIGRRKGKEGAGLEVGTAPNS